MPADIGAKITLQGEKQYREQMRQITQQTKTMRAETTALESAWGKCTTAQQKAAQQTQLLKSQIDAQKKSVETARANVQRFTEEYGENDRRTLKWKQTLAEAEAELHRLENALQSVPNQLEIMGQKMQENGKKIQSVGRAMTNVGSTLTKTVTAPVVAMGAAAVKTTADFDESMSKVQALSGATGKDFDALRTKARQMGASTKYSAGESADALSYMALAGWDTNQMLDGLDGVMNLAAASGMDLASASDLVTDYLSAFGLEAKDSSRMADQLAYAQAHSNTTTTQLGDAFGNTAAQMHTAGQSMETTTAILEAFANQGMKGSEAGTALSAMVRDISQKMKNGRIQIGDTTVAVKDQNGNFRNMIDILADVEEATEGMGSAEKTVALQQTFTARSIKGVSMALTEGSDNIRGYESALYSADGTANAMAETMQNNLKGQLTILKSQVQELGISFGDILVPHVRKAVQWLQNTVDKFNSLDKSTKEQIVKFAGLAAAIGPVLLVGGKLTTSIGKIVEGAGKAVSWIGKVTGGIGGAESAVGSFAGALGPLALAVGGVVGAVALAKAGYENFRQAAKDTNGDLYNSIDAVNETTGALNEAGDSIAECFAEADKSIQDVESTAKAATTIADEIEKLTKKSKLTHQEQLRLKALVGEMNALYPEMGLAIDDTTGKLNKSTKAIREYIDEAYRMAKVEAYANALKATMEAMADAEFKAAQAGIAHDRLLEEQAELEGQVADATKKRDNITIGAALTDTKAATEKAKLNDEITTGKVALEDAQKALEANKEAQNENKKAVDDAQKAYDDAYKVLEEYAAEMGVTVEDLLNMTDAAGENEEAVRGAGDAAAEAGEDMEGLAGDVGAAADEIDEATQKIIDAYAQNLEAAKSSVEGQAGLWKEFAEKEAVSAETIRKNLQSQAQAYGSWNSNVSRLVNSGRYQHDEAFRAMVDSLIDAGVEMAPELQTIVDLYETGDRDLKEILSDYGNAHEAAEEYEESQALFKTATEYGTKQTKEALKKGASSAGREAANIPKNVEKAYRENQPKVKSVADKLWQTVKDGITGISNQSASAKSAGAKVTKSTQDGLNLNVPGVKIAMGSAAASVSDGITNINGMSARAKAAGETTTNAVGAGISIGTKGAVKPNADNMGNTVDGAVKGIANLITSATSAGRKTAEGVASGIESGTANNVKPKSDSMGKTVWNTVSAIAGLKANAISAGDTTANGVATGLNNKLSIVSQYAAMVKDAVHENVSQVYSFDSYGWGSHMAAQLAEGMRAQLHYVKAKAEELMANVKAMIHFTHPDVGPLKEGTEIYGIHLARDYAKGMEKGIPAVEKAATGIAEAAATIPKSAFLDIDAVSGRNVANRPLTQTDLMSAVVEAASQINWKVMIGNREFGRALRDQGVAIA